MPQAILNEDHLQSVLRDFLEKHSEEFALEALGYFGSFARHEARPESDVDIVFKTTRPNLLATVRMREMMVERLGRPVDLIRYRENMNPRLRSRIQREAVYV